MTWSALTCSAVASAATPAYAEVREALAEGRYVEAGALAEALAGERPSAAAYEALALAHLRQGRLAPAVWALRSATALGGSGAPTGRLRDEVYAELPSELRPLPRRGISAAAAWTTRTLGPNALAGVALLALLVAGGLAALSVSGVRRSLGIRTTAGTAAVVGLLSLWIALRQNTLALPQEAVVLAEAPLQQAPSAGAPEARPLPAGTVVRIGERLSGYCAVTLPTGEEGWVSADVLRAVEPLRTAAAEE